MPKLVKINERGRRIGESHPRATLTDHEVDLLLVLLGEREALIEEMQRARAVQAAIDIAVARRGLSFRRLAVKFDISYSHVAKIARGDLRCQTPAIVKACP